MQRPQTLRNDEVEFVRTGYGKDMVKVLHIQRDGKYHSIKEVATSVQLTLNSKREYVHGDNSDIIPTDTIKNTVHVLAKFKGIKSIETFAMNICEHFLSSFNHVIRVQVYVEEVPWKRFEKNGVKHVHAFIHTPTGTHFCEVEQLRNGPPVIHSGIKDLKVLKTTQSGFEGFLKDQFTTLPEVKDRCFATQVYCKWRYLQGRDVDFEATWEAVRSIVLEKFAGPSDKGEYSPSVQKTLYDTQVLSLSQLPQIEDMEISLPNIHYFNIDMSKMGLINKEEADALLSEPPGCAAQEWLRGDTLHPRRTILLQLEYQLSCYLLRLSGASRIQMRQRGAGLCPLEIPFRIPLRVHGPPSLKPADFYRGDYKILK
ncbi:hypothetical protein MG293_001710 [Ovis ammon polii]|uniref:Uricase n=1 Tax=Ovis ammon polii TaxID=230172 RepID=A0AAD4URZ5_OVIAM|nr:hypothetical protein MG293_001710 [Ovis ammon polii]